MAADGFTIRIYVPGGDPTGVRFIDRITSTGLAISFPRTQWQTIRQCPEFDRAGIYVLSGYATDDAELPTLYIGQGDGVLSRIDDHVSTKDFWDWGFAFVSKTDSSGLNRAHITWLEHMLISQARRAKRSHLANSNTPSEPTLWEGERDEVQKFLTEILQVLPLVGLHAFEVPVPVATPNTGAAASPSTTRPTDEPDTVIVPAQKDGFDEVFLGQNAWRAIRIGGGMLPKIKYIAAYQSQPISAVTHVAPVAAIEPYGEDGKYKLVFSEPAKTIGPIPFADAPSGSMQGPRYTTYARLMAAKKVADLFSK